MHKLLKVLKSAPDVNIKHPHNPAGPGGGQFAHKPDKQQKIATYQGRTAVGITSYQAAKGTPLRQVVQHMKDFKNKLASLPGVSNVSVRGGWGGWDGGSEPSWVVSYDGGGDDAMKLLAETGKTHNQDGVLVLKPYGHPGAANTEYFEHRFEQKIGADRKKAIEAHLVSKGVGGWTWYNVGNRTTLRMVAVPQWGGDHKVLRGVFQGLSDEFKKAGLAFKSYRMKVSTLVMTKEGEHNYDRYITAA